MPISDRLVWCDLETFGLNDHDPIIEYAFVITDLFCQVIDDHTDTIWTTPAYDKRLNEARHSLPASAAYYVYKMHETSGLWDQARAYGIDPFQAQLDINDWLESHGVRGAQEPLCGNSVHQDRVWLDHQMPQVNERFHYRIVDVSTLKELCNKYDPETAAAKPEKGLAHRALGDLHETIAEFNHYRRWFFRDAIHEEISL